MTQLNSLPQNQRGATLMVSLILLVLISLIGIGALKSASRVEKISSNDFQKNMTFRASESAAAVTLATDDALEAALTSPTETTTINNVPTNIDGVNATVVYSLAGSAKLLNYSAPGGDAGGVEGIRVMITSTSNLTSNPESSTSTMLGIVRVAPAL